MWTLDDSDSDDDLDRPAVVIDNGSQTIKAGFSGDDHPKAIFSSLVGRLRHGNMMMFHGHDKDVFVGKEATEKQNILTLKYPIKRGIITNWDDLEKIWEHTFRNELQIEPKNHAALLTEPEFPPKAQREKMTQILFETFGVPAFYVSAQAILAVYATGRITALVLDLGHGSCSAVPVYEGHCLSHAVGRLGVDGECVADSRVGGEDLTEHMQKLLRERGYWLTTTAEMEIVRKVKEELSYVALDYEKEVCEAKSSSEIEQTYEMPDGQMITVGSERFQCPEALFKPVLIRGLQGCGIHQLAHQSILKCSGDIHRDLYENIVLAGGTSMFSGIWERMRKEMRGLQQKLRVKIIGRPDRKYSTWVGGSLVASNFSSSRQEFWISRDEYDEMGVGVVHRKCF